MKAVIATAGYSTRFLPVCKSVPKSMLPIQEVPIIHEIVKECIEAGITDVILVTSFGNYPVEDYFDNRPDLEAFLKDTGKEERYERFKEVFGKVNITVVRQNKALPYGNGSPVLAAKPWLKEGEPFVFIFSDDMVLSDVSAVKQLVDEYNIKKAADMNVGGVVAAQEVDEKEIHKYGAASFRDVNSQIIDTIVEKPTQNPPSLLATYGRYLVDYSIFDYLNMENMHEGELYFAVALDKLCKTKNVYCKSIDGEWLTTGDPLSYLEAQIKYAMRREDYREPLKKFFSNVLEER
jgi:UTP--glucose-1-phosphate uridylyltransferase